MKANTNCREACLITLSRTKTPGAPAAVLWSPDTDRLSVLRLPEQVGSINGAFGVTANDDFVFMLVQLPDEQCRRRSHLLALHRADLRLAALQELQTVNDPHSLCLHEGHLFAVSAGTDEVLKLVLNGPCIKSISTHWRPDASESRSDHHHLNSVSSLHGELVVAGFGRKKDKFWTSATQGFVYNITQERMLADNLYQPHSFLTIGDRSMVCESQTRKLRLIGANQEISFDHRDGGYPRGLALAAGQIIVGSSRRRTVSRSLGESLDVTSEERCGLYRMDASTFEVQGFRDLSCYAFDVFEILTVRETEMWPIQGEVEWRDNLIRGLDLAAKEIRLEMYALKMRYEAAIAGHDAQVSTSGR